MPTIRRAAAVMVVAIVAACASPAPSPPTPGPVVVAPVPKEYSCAVQRRAGAELRALPGDAALRLLFDDYRDLRIRLRALHRRPEPAACRAVSP